MSLTFNVSIELYLHFILVLVSVLYSRTYSQLCEYIFRNYLAYLRFAMLLPLLSYTQIFFSGTHENQSINITITMYSVQRIHSAISIIQKKIVSNERCSGIFVTPLNIRMSIIWLEWARVRDAIFSINKF